MKAERLAATALPKGYDKPAMLLRRFLLDLRSRLRQLPSERHRMLERRVYEFHRYGRKGITPGSRAGTAGLLANAVD